MKIDDVKDIYWGGRMEKSHPIALSSLRCFVNRHGECTAIPQFVLSGFL